MGTHTHKKNAPRSVTIGILTVSTTRSLETDESGKWIEGRALNSGHSVACRQIVPDDAVRIAETVSAVIRGHHPQVLILTGGTGITPEDVTIEAVRPMLQKEFDGFRTAFRFSQPQRDRIGRHALAGNSGRHRKHGCFLLAGQS